MPRGSWYSQLPPFGWFDPQDRPGSAAYQVGGRSIPDSQQGIALPTRGGLGKWYNVTPPGSDRPFPMQQTDIGPAPSTGRGIDISAAGAHQMGYTPKNFPTDANFKAEPIDLTGLGLAAKWNGGVPGDNQTAVAEGPPPQQGRKMPNSLMDMFQAQNPAGEPVGFGDAVTSRSNSLIGLGLGLLSPSNPLRGESTWGNALQGYMGGAGLDTRQAQAKAVLAHQKAQDAFQRSQAAQSQSNFERTFARNDPANAVSPAQTAMRDVLGPDATPEQKSAFMQDFYKSKTEGNLVAQADQRRAIAQAQGLDTNDPKVRNWVAGGGALNEEGKPLPAETAAAIAMGGKFLDEAPAIRAKIASGMATDTITGKVKTYLNAGEQGEVARKVKSGTEALLRALTGAGMGIAEAQKYVERYEIQPTDSSTGALSKFDQLQDELTRREQEAFRGRGGVPRDLMDRRKAAHAAHDEATRKPPATASEPATPAATAAPVRVTSPGAARKLPSGTQIILPDGRLGTVP